MPLLEIADLSVDFATAHGAFRAVDGVSLSVEAGDVQAIVGESGSGKSVAMLAVMGLLPWTAKVTAARLAFDGHDLLGMSPRRRRWIIGKDMAMIFQEPMSSLNPCFTVGYQIGEALKAHMDLDREQRRRRAMYLLSAVGISDVERRLRAFPHQLSGGMNQRVMIAMALALGPSVLVADEPTSALDVTVQARILRLLKSLLRSSVGAAVVITHDLGVVRFLATDVAVMRNGEIVEQGPVDQVFGEPRHDYTRHLFASIPGGRSFRTRGPGQPVVAAEAQS